MKPVTVGSRILRGDEWAEQLAAVLAPARQAPRQWMALHTTVLKDDRFSLVGLFELGGEFSYLKLYEARQAWQRLWFRAGRGRAVVSFDMGLALFERGLPVPEPRACLLAGADQLFLQQGLRNVQDLDSHWLGGLEPTVQGLWMQRCGELLGRLHREGFAHGDCKWNNLLCQAEKLFMADLDAASRNVDALFGKDLARFTLNAEERELDPEHFARFLDSYQSLTGRSSREVRRAMARPLAKMRDRHRRQYGARGRRLVD